MSPGQVWTTLRRQFGGPETRVPRSSIPVVAVRPDPLSVPSNAGVRAIWLGHATTLVEVDGVRILTDPIWSDRCSPFQWIGPKRFFSPPLELELAGRIDVVVISHDHFDHLDMATIRRLAATATRFVVPLGIGSHLERWGVEPARLTELDWDQTTEIAGIRIRSLPARHYSGRRPTGVDRTLWSSWAIIGPRHRVYISGDTGYFDQMKDIGAELGPFDLGIIKIGAYGETWPDIHLTPEEAVRAQLAVGARVLLAVHWATFNLAFHDWWEPADRLAAAATTAGVEVAIPRPGELVELGAPLPTAPWWRP
jgi:L-ascorbate metabolism protein UlaG (beta-lactamase superfamily)